MKLCAFLQNKANTDPYDLVVNVCSEFCSEEDIAANETLLYDMVQPTARYKMRRGNNKKAQNIRDIVNIFLTHSASEVPTFVAHNLNRLPPLEAKGP